MYMVLDACTGRLRSTGPSRLQLTGLHNPADSSVFDSVCEMQVQRVQRHLLRMIHSDYPDLMYPAALGCLADLEEVIKLNNLQCRTDALPQCCALDAAPSTAYGKAVIQQYLQPVFGPVDIKSAPATQSISRSVVIALGCRLRWLPL